MPGTSKKISELESASSLNNGDLIELASVNALSETGYSSKKTTIEDVADKVATLNPQAQADWAEADTTDPSYIQNKPTLATVATSGSYNDLSDQPTIPAAQVNSDWNSSSGVSEILNKPTLGTSASKDVGVANGVAGLDANGLVPTSQLPSFVDDVVEYANRSAFPATGETGKIYVALDTNLTYRWGGTEYVEISPSLALGETSSTAYAGDKGKANADAISAIQTALSGLATVATTGDYDDLIDKPTIPTVNNATVTFTQGGTTKGTITLNQAADATIALDAGGGGGASALDDLTDVTITNPTAGQVLKYDATNDEWVNGTGGGGSNSVELTYAEYQALTPEQQLDGTEYFITDINGDGQDFQPIIYSEEEREVGVWLDGKPLYEKTFCPSSALSNGSWNNNVLGTNNSDIEIKDFHGYVYGDSSDYSDMIFSTDYYRATEEFIATSTNGNGTDINMLPKISGIGTLYIKNITVHYTKTTDQAGSGTWTPQGVPAHHYSTDEQVVGTWVDGKTLYEKTIDYTVNKSASHTFDFTDGNIKRVVDGFIINSLNSICFPVNCSWEGKTEEFLYDETHFYIKTSANLGDSNTLRIIVQYTKSST